MDFHEKCLHDRGLFHCRTNELLLLLKHFKKTYYLSVISYLIYLLLRLLNEFKGVETSTCFSIDF